MSLPKKPKPGPGRGSKYRAEYAEQARIACAEGGFTDAKLAKLFGVAKATIVLWRHKHEAFAAACTEGKDTYLVSTAEECLRKRVEGYTYFEETYEPVLPPIDQKTGELLLPPEGLAALTGKLVLTKRVKKQLAPDVGAIRFALTNRAPARWAEKHKAEISGGLDVSHTLPEEAETLLARLFAQMNQAEQADDA